MIPVSLAASLMASEAIAYPGAGVPQEPCHVITSKDTKRLFPAGLIDHAAAHCWAGKNTDTLLLRYADISDPALLLKLYLARGKPESRKFAEQKIKDTESFIISMLPESWRHTYSNATPKIRTHIAAMVAASGLEETHGHTYKFSFEDSASGAEKNLSIIVINEGVAVTESLGVASKISQMNINKIFLYDSDYYNGKGHLAYTFAHESGHNAHPGRNVRIIDGQKISIPARRTSAEIMAEETAADLYANKYYAEALDAGVDMPASTPEVYGAARALFPIFFSNFDNQKKYGFNNFSDKFIKVPDLTSASHATLSHLPFNSTWPAPEKQEKGMLAFRSALMVAFNQALSGYEPPSSSLAISVVIKKCREIADEARAAVLPKGSAHKHNPDAVLGRCMTDTPLYAAGIAFNAALEIVDKGGFPKDSIAQAYLNAFVNAAAYSPVIDPSFYKDGAHVYYNGQRGRLKPETQKLGDAMFLR